MPKSWRGLILLSFLALSSGCKPDSPSAPNTPSPTGGINYGSLSPSELSLWRSLYIQSEKSAPSADPSIPPPFSRDFVNLAAQASPEADFQETLKAWKLDSRNVLLHAGDEGSIVLLQKYLFIAALSANTGTHTLTTYAHATPTQTTYIYTPTQLQLQFRPLSDLTGVTACFENVDQTFNIQGDNIVSVTYHYNCEFINPSDFTETYIRPIPVPSILRGPRLSPSAASLTTLSSIPASVPPLSIEPPLNKAPIVVVSPLPPTVYIPLGSPAGQVALRSEQRISTPQHQSTAQDLLHPHLSDAIVLP